MKNFKRVLALALAVVMLCAGTCFAAAAAVVSPAANSVVTGDSLLVSVKVTELKTVRVSVFEEKIAAEDGSLSSANVADVTAETIADFIAEKKFTDCTYAEPVDYTCTGEVGFYTKQLSSVNPGLYKVQVETLEEDGTASETVSSFVAVKAKPVAEVKADIFATPQTGALQFLQTILKSLFK